MFIGKLFQQRFVQGFGGGNQKNIAGIIIKFFEKRFDAAGMLQGNIHKGEFLVRNIQHGWDKYIGQT